MKQDKTPLTRSAFVSGFRAALVQAGYLNSETSHYSGHSFRAGAASTAAALGIEDSLIKTLGRWELGIPYLPSPTKNRFATSVKTIITVPGPGKGVMSFTNSTE